MACTWEVLARCSFRSHGKSRYKVIGKLAASMTKLDVLRLLQSVLSVLESTNEGQWSKAFQRQILRLSAATAGTSEYRQAIRDCLRLYGGMGSFQDLVLQDINGVLPQQQDLDRYRRELFTALQTELNLRSSHGQSLGSESSRSCLIRSAI